MDFDDHIKVSVIIPMYNAERYIEKCVNSIRMQTVKNIEIIIIDDASGDNSLKIVKMIKKCDSRISIIRNVENIGVSRSRNKGMQIAKGEFLVFVDADDYVSNVYLEVMLNLAEANPDYLAMCSMKQCFDTDFVIERDNLKYETSIKKYNFAKYVNNQYAIHPWACACAFKKDIIRNNCIFFKEGVRFAEDAYFVVKYCNFCRGVIISDKELYFYYIHADGGAINKLDKAYTERDVLHRITCLEALKDALEYTKKNSPNNTKYVRAGFCFLSADMLLMQERAKTKYKIEELKSYLKTRNVLIFFWCCHSYRFRLFVMAIKISSRFTRILLDDLQILKRLG